MTRKYFLLLLGLVFCDVIIVSAQSTSKVYTPPESVQSYLPAAAEKVPVILTWDYNVVVMGPAEIKTFVQNARDEGIHQINLRISNKGVANARFNYATVYTERLNAFGEDFDPLKVLVSEGRKNDVRIGVHFDLFETSYDQFFIQNPQFTPQKVKDSIIYSAFPCYAAPQVRNYLLDRVRELAAYKVDQVFFCTKSSHTPRNMVEVPRNSLALFNPEIIKIYKDRYGKNISEVPEDVQRVAEIHGEFIIEFLKDARDVLHADGIESIAGATLSGYLQPSGNNIYLSWEKMVREEVADALVMTNSRKETFEWYEENAPKVFWDILALVKDHNMDLYGYILSTVYWKIRDEKSRSDMLAFIPDQLEYFHRLGADAVLIHEVYNNDIWHALGAPPYKRDYDDLSLKIPSIEQRPAFRHFVPAGDFNRPSREWFWTIEADWLSLKDWLPNVDIVSGLNVEQFNEIWKSQTDNPHLSAEYDWKVMANDPHSGRSYSGRSAILFYSDTNAHQYSGRKVAWTATSDILNPPEDSVLLTFWHHGEHLEGIDKASAMLEVFDSRGELIDVKSHDWSVSGTYPWQEIEIPFLMPKRGAKIKLELSMTVRMSQKSRGAMWIDGLKMHLTSENQNNLLFITDTASHREFASIEVVPGHSFKSREFIIPSDSRYLTFSMRADTRESENVEVQIADTNAIFEVGADWKEYRIPLKVSDSKRSTLKFRPHTRDAILIDDIAIIK